MAQDTEANIEATEEVTTAEDLNNLPENLAPESTGQETPEQPDLEKAVEKPAAPALDLDGEQTLEFGGKTYTLKGKELQSILDNQQALSEREKALNRDYTQKLQKLSEERKSLETVFGGRAPDPQELQAMSKIVAAYNSDPQAQKVLQAIIDGQPLDAAMSEQAIPGKASANPDVAALKSEIHALKGQLSQFLSTSEQKEQQAAADQGKRIFDTWLEGKTKSGVKVDETQIDPILEWAGFLREKNPSWDAARALNEAYRHITIDSVEKTATDKVFAKAESAKKAPTIKITPKSSQKTDANMGYKEMFLSAM